MQYQVLNRVTFVNLESLEERRAQFNPEQFTKSINVEWKRFQIAGLPYEPVMYSHTGNQEFTLTLPWRVASPAERQDFEEFVKFIEACMYPLSTGGSPPDVLYVWPNVVAVPVKITSYTRTDTLFNRNGQATRTDLNLSMFWVRRQALLAADIRERGTVENG